MKIRNGFVSNSSSSSFIVTFPQEPKTREILAKMMGDCSVYPYDTHVSTEEVVNRIWSDIEDGRCGIGNISHLSEKLSCHWGVEDEAEALSNTVGKEHQESLYRVLTYLMDKTDEWSGPEYYYGYGDPDEHWDENTVYPNESYSAEYLARIRANDNIDIAGLIATTCSSYITSGIMADRRASAINDMLLMWFDMVNGNEESKRAFEDLFPPKNADDFVYIFEISDESRVGSAMEHGGVFRNLPHKRISHH